MPGRREADLSQTGARRRGLARAGGGAVPRRYSSWATGCSAAWLARVLWVLQGVLSNLTAIAALTWAFDARGCKILTARQVFR